MYGYIRLIENTTPPSIHQQYRTKYCSLCHSLWNNYGLKSRFLLSYDMTFLAIVLDLKDHVDVHDNMLCFRKVKILHDQEKWKELAGLSILLAGKKLEDDIIDENSIKAKIGLKTFEKAFKKAENDYPIVARILEEGFREMSLMEKDGKDVYGLSERFGKIIVDSVREMFPCSKEDLAIMKHVTKWVYFIDALDDLEKDAIKGRYNPFIKLAKTKKELLSNHYLYLEQFVMSQTKEIKESLTSFVDGTSKNWIIMSTITNSMPIVTEKVLNNDDPYCKNRLIVQFAQVYGGYKIV